MAEPPRVAPRRPGSPARRRDAQRELDFLPSAVAAPRTRKTKVESSIFCDADVATLVHRSFAGCVDLCLILIGYGLLLSAYSLMGGAFPVSRLSGIVFGSAFGVLAAFYGLLWALANGETPGMRWTRLRLTNFDGFPPERGARMLRYFATCLSFATCGFGLLWALVDEENLTCQDHISKTFPTFQRLESSFLRGR